jgi:Bacterial Ig domain
MDRGRLLFRAGVLLLVVTLAACGGGVFIGVDGSFDDSPPSVSLAVAPTSVAPGQSLRMAAAASDESGIDRVEFYRFDGPDPVRLATLGGPPWEWTTTVPTDGRRQLMLFARATDGAGNTADSGVVTVAVSP